MSNLCRAVHAGLLLLVACQVGPPSEATFADATSGADGTGGSSDETGAGESETDDGGDGTDSSGGGDDGASMGDGAVPSCGNGSYDDGEACDGDDLAGKKCVDLGFASGALACTPSCTLDTSGCSDQPQCGDGQLAEDELCDGDALLGATCESMGLGSGELGCVDCTWDASGCSCAGKGEGCSPYSNPNGCCPPGFKGIESGGCGTGSLTCG